jgi:hypothetical protein
MDNGKDYPIYYGKIKAMFETTNQINSGSSYLLPEAISYLLGKSMNSKISYLID